MEILVALIPALAWGSVGLFTTKLGGSAGQGVFGTTLGAFLFGVLTLLFFVIPTAGFSFAFNPRILIVGLLSGIFWSIGSAAQFVSFKQLGVSIGNPLTTAGQIIGNALLAASVLGEWTTSGMWLFGLIAILLVTIGAILTALPDRSNQNSSSTQTQNVTGGLIAVVISTLGFMGYFIVPNLFSKIGFISDSIKNQNSGIDYMTAVVAPQAVGQVLGAAIIVIFFMREANLMFKKETFKNILTGLVWAAGNIAMFISAANSKIGQATAATLSQMGIIVGTFGAIYLLGEKKTGRQMFYIVVGSLLVVAGGMLTGNLSLFK